MALSSIDLWQRIATEGLASPMQCRSWAAETAKSLDAADNTDGLKVLQALIDLGKLTNYQAKILAGQSDRPLFRGPWAIVNRVKDPLWKDWLSVSKIDLTKAEVPPRSWARWLTPEDLESLRSSAPSLPRGLQLASVQHEHLQSVRVPEMGDGELQVLVAPVEGQLLSEQLKSPLPSETVTSIITQLASGLAALHAKNLVHGRVLPDRVYFDGKSTTLALDPISVLTATLDPSATGLLGEQLHGMQSTHFLAPEFIAPGQMPSLASDIYALGCTWWWMLIGKPVATGTTAQQILASHASTTPQLPAEIEYPEPLRRCLAHCLAKNLSARFATASELSQAIDEATRVVAIGKVEVLAPQSAVSEPEVAEPVVTKTVVVQPIVASTPVPSEPVKRAPVKSEAVKSEAAKSEAAPLRAAASSPKQTTTAAKPLATTIKQPTSAAIQKVVPDERTTTAAVPKVVEPKVVDAKAAESKAAPTASESKPTRGKTSKATRAKPAATRASTSRASTSSTNAGEPRSSELPVSESDVTAKPPRLLQPAETTESSELGVASETVAEKKPAELKSAEDKPETLKPEQLKTTGNKATAQVPAAAEKIAATTAASNSLGKDDTKQKAIGGQGARRIKRRKRGNKWLLPVVGGCGFIILMLGVLKLSGALEPSKAKNEQATQGYVPPVTAGGGTGTIIQRDPRLDYYNIIDDDSQLWVPPAPLAPLKLDLLPPGGQLFVSLQPKALLADAERKTILATFEQQLSPLLDAIKNRSGLSLEAIEQVSVGFYSAKTSGAIPEFALRVQLAQPTTLAVLKTKWQNPGKAKLGEQELLASDELAYYIAQQPLVDSQTVAEFSVGPIELMREVAELGGNAGPMNAQMESMLRKTDSASDLCILLSPRYLLSEGRGLLDAGPERLREQLSSLLGNDPRAALLQTRFVPDWYFELQIVGASDRDAPGLMANLQSKLQELPSVIETWFVDESPHPYWRALALRYPQMLRAVGNYSRFGVEDGSAVMNGYLAPQAAPNLLLASWIALQDSATMSSGAVATSGEPAAAPLSIEEYLDRGISVSFDREPIEVALELVAEAANKNLPGGTPKLTFVIDGDAFEKGGITRNQPLSDYNMRDKSVRENLTEIARRGNTTPGAELTSPEQKLVWVIADAANGEKVARLTTRDAAKAASIALPAEFMPATP